MSICMLCGCCASRRTRCSLCIERRNWCNSWIARRRWRWPTRVWHTRSRCRCGGWRTRRWWCGTRCTSRRSRCTCRTSAGRASSTATGACRSRSGCAPRALQSPEFSLRDSVPVRCAAVQAEKVIRERLAVAETPELLCALGEVTRDESCLQRAWERSGRRHARAMTALALTCLNRGLVRLVSEPELDSAHVHVSTSRLVQLERAAECFEQALAVNPLVASCWFTLGCVRLQQRSFGAAVAAFRRAATLEPDNFQAWANLATALVQTKQKCAAPHLLQSSYSSSRARALHLLPPPLFRARLLVLYRHKAFHILKEAIKANYEEWRVWENYVFVWCPLSILLTISVCRSVCLILFFVGVGLWRV